VCTSCDCFSHKVTHTPASCKDVEGLVLTVQRYNCKRRHGALNGLTPMQKWAQGTSRLPDRQLFEPGSVDLSRPDRVGSSVASALYSLDKSTEPAYLRLAGEQDSGQALVANSFEKIVQKIGG
jgi:hypothetical protein